jgi:hypothetical protein
VPSRFQSLSLLVPLALLAPAPAAALTPLAAVRVSPDVTTPLGVGVFADEGVAEDDLGGSVVAVALGALPAEADVAAYHALAGGGHLLVFDATTVLPGPLAVGPADVVRFDGVSYSLELAGASVGIPSGARIDALGVDGLGRILVSLDVDASLGALVVDDADVVAIGGGPPVQVLDAAAAGITVDLDLDALHFLPDGNLLVSFSTGGTVAGLVFADEDVLELDPLGPSWELVIDADSLHAGWSAADLDALWALPGAAGPPPAAGEIRFVSVIYSESETAPFATIEVERVGGSAGAVAVSFFTADESALATADYLATLGVLNWADGELGLRSFDVPLLDDVLLEGPETVRLVLTGPTGGAVLGVPSVAQLVIQDDESNVLEIPTLGGLGGALLAGLLAGLGARRLRARRRG